MDKRIEQRLDAAFDMLKQVERQVLSEIREEVCKAHYEVVVAREHRGLRLLTVKPKLAVNFYNAERYEAVARVFELEHHWEVAKNEAGEYVPCMVIY